MTNAPRSPGLTDLGRRILANSRCLSEALNSENVTGGFPATHRELADKAAEGVICFTGQASRAEIRTGRKGIDWSGASYKAQRSDFTPSTFYFISPLAEEYKQTGDSRYAAAARDYIADWIRAHPTQENWVLAAYDSRLRLCIRVGGWCLALISVLGSEEFDDSFVQVMLESIAAQFEYLMGHIDTGNWGATEGDTLFRCGILFDFHPRAQKWRDKGVQVLNDMFLRDVLPDGAHIERTPDYHVSMTNAFRRYWRLGRAMPNLGLCMKAEPIAAMHDYVVATTRPDGMQNPIEDTHVRRLPEDAFAVRSEFRKEADLTDEPPPTSQFFPHAGQAFIRDGWGEDATYITFDATNWGGAHCHLSRNAVQLYAHRRQLVIDPGRFSYNPDEPMMRYARSTRAHSTVNLNGWNQGFANPSLTRFRSAEGYDVADSLYEGGYWSGPYTWYFSDGFGQGRWGEHHRTLLWVRGRCVVILDNVTYSVREGEEAFLESNWQLSPGPAEILPAGDAVATADETSNLLMLFPVKPKDAALSIHEGQTDPLRGWALKTWAPHSYVPAPQVCLRIDDLAAEPTTLNLATVLIPYAGSDRPEVTTEAADPGQNGCGELLLRWPDGSSDEISYRRRLDRALYECDRFETDGSLVHFQKDAAGKLVQGLVVDGTYISPQAPDARPRPETFVIH